MLFGLFGNTNFTNWDFKKHEIGFYEINFFGKTGNFSVLGVVCFFHHFGGPFSNTVFDQEKGQVS